MSIGYALENLYDTDPHSQSIRYVSEPHDFVGFTPTDVFVFRRPVRAPIDNTHRFDELAAMWEADTRYLSSSTQIVLHPAYQQIIGMGPAALPLILRRLQTAPHHWFWALRAITGEDPVEPQEVGNVAAMTDAWLRWAEEHATFE